MLAVFASCAPFRSAAFYLPGSFPQEFIRNASIGVKVSSLTSTQTELPFGYYSLPFCKPPGGVRKMAENLGELLMGERVESSPYTFNVMVPVRRRVQCSVILDKREARDLCNKVEDGYRVHMRLDGMPITNHPLQEISGGGGADGGGGGSAGGAGGDGGGGDWGGVQTGYPLGFTIQELGIEGKKTHYLNNHLVFNVLVHKMDLSTEQLDAYETFEKHRKQLSASAAALAAAPGSGEEEERDEGNDGNVEETPMSVEPPHGWMIVG